jgi:hypothetical protein
MTKYVKEPREIADVLRTGISSMDTNENRTIVKTSAGGSYAFPTKEFNRLGNYGNNSPLFAAGIGLDLSGYSGRSGAGVQKLRKPKRLFEINEKGEYKRNKRQEYIV